MTCQFRLSSRKKLLEKVLVRAKNELLLGMRGDMSKKMFGRLLTYLTRLLCKKRNLASPRRVSQWPMVQPQSETLYAAIRSTLVAPLATGPMTIASAAAGGHGGLRTALTALSRGAG